MDRSTAIVLVRHPAVQHEIKGFCYGTSDVSLSQEGYDSIPEIVHKLSIHRPDRVVHSGLSRASLLAEAIADSCNSPISTDQRLSELNFGEWERRPWKDIFAEVGHAMSKMIHQPNSFAPPGGETVLAMRNRVLAGLRDLPRSGTSLVVCHGGPISALRGTLAGVEPYQWTRLVPGYGEAVVLSDAQRSMLSNVAQAT
ncbi:MAG: histidine phosphatase family protein [Hyphomicrobiaceae bacterium]